MARRLRRELLLDRQCSGPSLGRGQLERHGIYVELLESVLQRNPHGARFRGQHRPRARQHHQSRPARPLQVRVEIPARVVLLVPAPHVRAVREDRQTPLGGYGLRRLPACSLRRVCRVCLPASERGVARPGRQADHRLGIWTSVEGGVPGRHLESPSACRERVVERQSGSGRFQECRRDTARSAAVRSREVASGGRGSPGRDLARCA